MKILVLGAGAIGSVFGGLLAKAGHLVVLIGRGPHIRAVVEDGLAIDGIWGTHTIRGLRGYTGVGQVPADMRSGIDAVLLAVKSYDTVTALEELCRHVDPVPPVVSLQNGLGNIEAVASHVGVARTIGGRVIFGVEFSVPGHVTVTVSADRTKIGGMDSGAAPDAVRPLAEACCRAGIPTDVTDNIERYIWGKVLYNCSLNGLATIVNVQYGKLLESEGARHIMRGIVEEIFSVASLQGVQLEWNRPDDYARVLFEVLIPRTYEHHPSMLQDIRKGKKTEIDALNGAVVRLGKGGGLDLPYNEVITQFIKARERI